ncbi:MAG: N-acetyl-gamma-glutamyl-phosphate reductase [Dehalococcoidia bacterium]
MKIGIINVTGYAGAEVARIAFDHPEIELVSVTGRSGAGKKLSEVFPHLFKINLTITPDIETDVDFVFSGLPHAASAEALSTIVKSGIKAVDISADFRLQNLQTYKEWYQIDHPTPELLKESVYGLPELYKQKIKNTSLVANPGCYPTASILGLAPALKNHAITSDIIIDAKSGVSGAGRTLSLKTHFSEVSENLSAYGVDGHRHMPEIAQELDKLADHPSNLTFIPHLIPMNRGILATCYAPLSPDFIEQNPDPKSKIIEIYKSFYKNENFTHVVDQPPMTKHTLGSNDCLIYPTVDLRTNRLIVISCLDNLVKGAAGQAIHNMNIMSGFTETAGLTQLSLYP